MTFNDDLRPSSARRSPSHLARSLLYCFALRAESRGLHIDLVWCFGRWVPHDGCHSLGTASNGEKRRRTYGGSVIVRRAPDLTRERSRLAISNG